MGVPCSLLTPRAALGLALGAEPHAAARPLSVHTFKHPSPPGLAPGATNEV